MRCAAALRFMTCSLLVASLVLCCCGALMLGCIVVPVVADVGATR